MYAHSALSRLSCPQTERGGPVGPVGRSRGTVRPATRVSADQSAGRTAAGQSVRGAQHAADAGNDGARGGRRLRGAVPLCRGDGHDGRAPAGQRDDGRVGVRGPRAGRHVRGAGPSAGARAVPDSGPADGRQPRGTGTRGAQRGGPGPAVHRPRAARLPGAGRPVARLPDGGGQRGVHVARGLHVARGQRVPGRGPRHRRPAAVVRAVARPPATGPVRVLGPVAVHHGHRVHRTGRPSEGRRGPRPDGRAGGGQVRKRPSRPVLAATGRHVVAVP